jgi:hypothetical protein
VSSPSILSSPSAICLSLVLSPTLFRLTEFQAVPTIYTARSRASERHNLDVYLSCSLSLVSVSRFRVKTLAQIERSARTKKCPGQAALLDRRNYMANTVLAEFADLEDVHCRNRGVVSNHTAKSQESLWIERTRWTRHLEDVQLSGAVTSIRTPHHTHEPMPAELTRAIDHLVDTAYASVLEDKVIFFG